MDLNVEKTASQVLVFNSLTFNGAADQADLLGKDSSTAGNFYKKARAMRRHPTIALARQLSVAPLLAADWSAESNEDAPEGAKEEIDKQMQSQRVNLLRSSLFGCMDFGWQPYEKVFTYDEQSGFIRIKKLKPLIQDRTYVQIIKENGSYNGLMQLQFQTETAITTQPVFLTTDESLLVNFDVEGTNWYGIPLIQGAELPYDNWLITNTANVRYDKKIAGAHWIIHYPAGKSVVNGVDIDNYLLASQMLAALEQSGSFIVPRQLESFVDDMNKDAVAWKIELISAQQSSAVAFIDRMKYLDALMVRGFGLPERAVLEGQFGTKAEAEAHADFAITNMELRHQIIVQQYNKFLVNQILSLNWGEQYKDTVWMCVAPLTNLTIQYLRSTYAEVLKNAQGFAAEIGNIDMQSLRDRLGIPTINPNDPAAADAIAAQAKVAQGVVLSFLNKLGLE